MSKVILIRHAQASLGKSNYDELSQLGFKQAAILGKYFQQYETQPETIITGNLNRHQQTASEINKAYSNSISMIQDKDWNEFDFKTLIQTYLSKYPEETPASGDVRAFFTILKKSMLEWSQDNLDMEGVTLESWAQFNQRINRAIANISPHSERPTFVVSSGGAIAMLLMSILETNPKTMINMNFQIRNTSFTELLYKPGKTNLVTFNQINHLTEIRDQNMITYA